MIAHEATHVTVGSASRLTQKTRWLRLCLAKLVSAPEIRDFRVAL